MTVDSYIRRMGHLPKRTCDTREIDDTRQMQQEQSQPPEISTRTGTNEKEEEMPKEKVEAAKKRLGRSEDPWDFV